MLCPSMHFITSEEAKKTKQKNLVGLIRILCINICWSLSYGKQGKTHRRNLVNSKLRYSGLKIKRNERLLKKLEKDTYTHVFVQIFFNL